MVVNLPCYCSKECNGGHAVYETRRDSLSTLPKEVKDVCNDVYYISEPTFCDEAFLLTNLLFQMFHSCVVQMFAKGGSHRPALREKESVAGCVK